MKLASLKSGRDGRLVVVSRDLTRAIDAGTVAPTLQAALERWETAGPRLAVLSRQIELGSVPTFRFREHDAASPLPSIGDGRVLTFLAVAQPRDGAFLNPRDPIALPGDATALDLQASVAAVTGELAKDASSNEVGRAIRLLMLVSGAPQLASACSPVAVTPDELGEAWRDGKLHLPLIATLNGKPQERTDTAQGLAFDVGDAVAQAVRARSLAAGCIVAASGAERARSVGLGLRLGDTIRIEMHDRAGHSIFGAIEHQLCRPD